MWSVTIPAGARWSIMFQFNITALVRATNIIEVIYSFTAGKGQPFALKVALQSDGLHAIFSIFCPEEVSATPDESLNLSDGEPHNSSRKKLSQKALILTAKMCITLSHRRVVNF